MTFSEQAAELHRLEAVAMSLGLSETGFERILKTVMAEMAEQDAGEKLAEIRRRVYAAQTKPLRKP